MKKYIINAFALAFMGLMLIPDASAQDGEYYTVRDFEVWTAASLKYKINKKWSAGLEQQFRFKDDASTIDQYFTEAELKRKLGKHFSAALGGRYIRKNDTEGKIQGYENRFRWNVDLAYKHDIDRLSLKYRVRYQSRNEISVEDENKTTFRLKVASEYNIKKWAFDPKFSAELFNGLSDNEGFNRLRMTLGTEYKTKNLGEIGAFYRIERELTGIYPKTTNIAGFTYQYTLKRKNDKKEVKETDKHPNLGVF